jgi:hypothetical protein
MMPQVKSGLLITTGLLLSTAALATGCGGGGGSSRSGAGGSDTMRVSLTDDGITDEGDTTPAPGPFNIEVENKTSHFANFTLSALPAGKNVEDVQHAVEQGPAIKLRGVGGVRTGPGETSLLFVYESRGRFVIGCWVHTSAAAAQSDVPPPPLAVYVVPVELEVR